MNAKSSATPFSGILLVDKPQEWTSHDVVGRVRRLAGMRKVGHAGTLDPMATGMLVVGLGSSTRLLTYVVGTEKEYLATIRLGAASTTDDAEGELLERAPAETVRRLTREAAVVGMGRLTGDIMQVPSSVSAIKVNGERAYARVRAGEDVELASRPVTVSEFELLDIELVSGDDGGAWLDLRVRVVCSSGTYIRALARDLGADLGVGGHLTALRRTRVGPFSIEDAAELDGLDVADRLIRPAVAAAALFPTFSLSPQQTIDLGHGKRIVASDDVVREGPVAAVAPNGRLVGLIEFTAREARSLVNFPSDELVAESGAKETPA